MEKGKRINGTDRPAPESIMSGKNKMFFRKYDTLKNKVESTDGAGIKIVIPKWCETNISFASKQKAKEKGLRPKGTKNFYVLECGIVIINKCIARENTENRIRIEISRSAAISKALWEEIKEEIDSMLEHAENN